MAFFWLLRLNRTAMRTAMVALITGAGAFAAGAGGVRALWLTLAAYFTGEFSAVYLYLDLVFIAVGLVCAWLFATRPSPRLAYALTIVFMMGLGSLICLAMVIGSM